MLDYWWLVDVRLFHDIRICRSLRLLPQVDCIATSRHQNGWQCHDRVHVAIHLRVRRHLGPHRVGACGRNIPFQIQSKIDGFGNICKLDLELSY